MNPLKVSAQCKNRYLQIQSSFMARSPVAYLVNQYPKVSHSFIRREILALERQGLTVHRFALRGWEEATVDAQDTAEKSRTRYLLQQGAVALLSDALALLLNRPATWLRALALALRMSRQSDRSLPYHLVYFLEACRLVRWCEAAGVAHLHAHFGTNPAEVAMLSKALGGPDYSFTVHGPEEFDKPEFLGMAEKIKHSAFVVAISSYGRSQLYRWIAQNQWHKVKVVHCGLEAAFHANPASQTPKPNKLVCIGRLCEQKGQLLLLQAARLVADRGIDFELVLAGDGEMRAQIEAEIHRLSLGHQVSITGWISSERVQQELLSSRAMVLPSFAEGLPVVIMEAMALRRPVVTTYVAGIPELVGHGQSGWLCPAGDVHSLADALAECLQASEETLARMGETARERVLARHDVDVEASKLAGLFSGQVPPQGVASCLAGG